MSNRKPLYLRLPMFVGLALLCAPMFGQEQGRWRVELLPGAALPTAHFGGAELNTGGGVEGNISYRFLPHLATYGGWDWHLLKTDVGHANQPMDVEENGYVFGLRFDHPLGGSASPSLMLRAGGTYSHIELENDDSGFTADSGHGLGWEAGAGLGFQLSERWQITPGVRFRSLSRDFKNGNVAIPVKLRYVALEVGISRSF